MQITREHLREAAEAVLKFFEDQGITSLQDIYCISPSLRESLESPAVYQVEGATGEVHVHKTPSDVGTIAQAVSYVLPGKGGMPLDIKMNEKLGHSNIIFKTLLLVPGYTPFVEDPFGNQVQSKKIPSIELADVVAEVEELAYQNKD